MDGLEFSLAGLMQPAILAFGSPSTPLRNCGTLFLLLFGFATQSAAKPNTVDGSTMLPFVLRLP